MADFYSPQIQQIGENEPVETATEGRPMLDQALPAPPPISELQDRLTGDPTVPQDGRVFVRMVSDSGARDVPDPGA